MTTNTERLALSDADADDMLENSSWGKWSEARALIQVVYMLGAQAALSQHAAEHRQGAVYALCAEMQESVRETYSEARILAETCGIYVAASYQREAARLSSLERRARGLEY